MKTLRRLSKITDVVSHQSVDSAIHCGFEYHFIICIGNLRPPLEMYLNRFE